MEEVADHVRVDPHRVVTRPTTRVHDPSCRPRRVPRTRLGLITDRYGAWVQEGLSRRDVPLVVTFDLFSALTDSRRGAAAAFAGIAAARGWPVSGEQLYDVWDRHNKELQRRAGAGTSFRELSRTALRAAYDELGMAGDAASDLDLLWRGVGDWPLWPDVEDGVAAVAARAAVGILSNVDDDLVVTTRAHRLVDPRWVLTSERLGAYKPSPEIYRRARRAAPGLVHVAASARDVRGALEAGIPTVRLVREGHRVDPDGPVPTVEVTDARDLPAALDRLERSSG